MHPELIENISEIIRTVTFQLFTNGQLITEDIACQLREVQNVTPLISIEGTEIASDERRGRLNVLNETLTGLQNCLDNKLITGVCTSLCQTNIDDLLTESWVDRLIEMKVLYMWYHVYRPGWTGPSTGTLSDPGAAT